MEIFMKFIYAYIVLHMIGKIVNLNFSRNGKSYITERICLKKGTDKVERK